MCRPFDIVYAHLKAHETPGDAQEQVKILAGSRLINHVAAEVRKLMAEFIAA